MRRELKLCDKALEFAAKPLLSAAKNVVSEVEKGKRTERFGRKTTGLLGWHLAAVAHVRNSDGFVSLNGIDRENRMYALSIVER